jgi:hypothetical protein
MLKKIKYSVNSTQKSNLQHDTFNYLKSGFFGILKNRIIATIGRMYIIFRIIWCEM